MDVFVKTISASTASHEMELQMIAYKYGFAPKILSIQKESVVWHVSMEHIGEGTSLADVYGENPEDIPSFIWTRIRYMVKILLEEEEIEYVDVTPYNFLEKNGRVYMIDFGDAVYSSPSAAINWYLQEFIYDKVNMWNLDFK
jgi:RIO-like serine/threonine protein kinase